MDEIRALAKEKDCKPSQLALAWVLAQGNDIVPIPGTKHARYLEENAGAINVSLTQNDLQRINEALPHGSAAGTRYSEGGMKAVGR